MFVPVLYYSLTTPFALIDDYVHSTLSSRLDSAASFFAWFNMQFCDLGAAAARYRPYWELYTAVMWKVLGANAAAHHSVQWVLHFGAVFLFAATLRCFYPRASLCDSIYRLLPVALMVYLWVFFPNSPASRLGPQEVHTVFFLGLCNWTAALAISDWRSKHILRTSPLSTLTRYVLFCIGYVGLTLSKETNIALSFWLLISYLIYGCYLAKRIGWLASTMSSTPLILVFLVAVSKIYSTYAISGVGYNTSLDITLAPKHAGFILMMLFRTDTSAVIAVGFMVLFATLLRKFILGLKERHLSNELVFVLFSVGQFTMMFIVLCASWAVTLRYWYPLVPVFSLLLAFSAKFLIEATEVWYRRRYVAGALILFGAFFVACNYHNFLLQTIVQHSLRSGEDRLVEHIFSLVDQGEYVVVERTGNEYEHVLIDHIGPFHRRFHGRPGFTVHVEKPEIGRRYFLVTRDTLSEYENATTITARYDYLLLSLAYEVAKVLQLGREPFVQVDGGVSYFGDGAGHWNVYGVRSGDEGAAGA